MLINYIYFMMYQYQAELSALTLCPTQRRVQLRLLIMCRKASGGPAILL